MIRNLRLKNLALVDDLSWELGPGFNILTGETGAGKSILIDGLNLLLGERADKTLIRSGEETCLVEAELELSDKALLKQLNAILDEMGAEPCDGNQLLLKRSFSAAGANKQFANGSPITLQGLKKLGDILVDVHGPHDHQSLLQPEKQIAILDSYGKLQPLLDEYHEAWEKRRTIRETREALQMSETERAMKLEILNFQRNEIEAAKPRPGDDLKIEQDYKIAASARQLLELSGTITNLLAEADGSALAQLALVEKALGTWQKIDDSLASTAALNRSAIEQLKELLAEITNRADRIDADGAQLQFLEERLNVLNHLKKKYGPELVDVIRRGEDAAAQADALASSAERLAQIAAEEKAADEKLAAAAKKLGKARLAAAEPLAKKIEQELRALGFAKALFRIDSAPAPEPTRHGADLIEFIFAPNVGEAPRPLRAIASSGEMARVMLAIKTTLAEVDEVPILIFDEIDANVGGETATQVGKKLRHLGRTHQVICITHLPQVAAQGEPHFAVSKIVKQKRSVTELNILEGDDRIEELARMLGGQSEKSRALAESLLQAG